MEPGQELRPGVTMIRGFTAKQAPTHRYYLCVLYVTEIIIIDHYCYYYSITINIIILLLLLLIVSSLL